jgi:hypothetical protein
VSWSKILPRSSKAFAILFRHDEAFRILRECIAIRARPITFARSIMGGRLVPPFRRARSILFEQFSHGVLDTMLSPHWRSRRRAARETTEPFAAPAKAVATTVALAGISSLMAWGMTDSVSGFIPFDMKHQATFIKLIYFLVLSYVLLHMWDFLVGWLFWLRGAIIRIGLVIGVKAAADLGLGNDGPQIAIKAVEDKPAAGNLEIIALPPALEEQVVARAIEAASHTTRQLYQTLAEGQVGLLGPTVTEVLSDATLVHAQYYQHPLVISLIADCIVGQPWRARA